MPSSFHLPGGYLSAAYLPICCPYHDPPTPTPKPHPPPLFPILFLLFCRVLAASFLPLLLTFLPLPACLHPDRRVESSPFLLALSRLPPPHRRTSVRASSHGDGTSQADISPQRYGPLMSMTSALTCLSFLRALTSSEWDKFPP